MPRLTSPAAQDYLKAMYVLETEEPESPAATSRVADRLRVSAASATNMLKRLGVMGLVEHVPYRGAVLTEAGRKVALEVIRHHRLLETYLAEALGVPWDRVHEEAEVLEHVLSEDLEDRIAVLLGHPTADPHGHPIPTKDLLMPHSSQRKLWQTADGERTTIDRVSDEQADVLRYLHDIGITPGARVEILRRGPVGGPLFVRVDDESSEVALSKDLAEAVWVG